MNDTHQICEMDVRNEETHRGNSQTKWFPKTISAVSSPWVATENMTLWRGATAFKLKVPQP